MLDRNGHTEASVDLARLAGLRPAGVICEIVSEKDPTDMARLPELREFADTHDLALISIEQMIQWRRRNEMQVVREVATSLPTDAGPMTALGYRHQVDGTEHVALIAARWTSCTMPQTSQYACIRNVSLVMFSTRVAVTVDSSWIKRLTISKELVAA